MVDMHCHILPNVDDGAANIDISKELIKKEVDEGNKYIVLTPHQSKRELCKDLLIEKFNELKENIDIECNLYLGCELYYYEKFIHDLEGGLILTMNNSKYLLIEFSTTLETNISDIVYDLSIKGYKPIVAHIERYDYLTFDDYNEIARYAKIQINSEAFMMSCYKKKLKYLLKNNLVTYIASDCHNLTSRPCDFSYAKKVILKKYKNQYDKLFNTIPEFLK